VDRAKPGLELVLLDMDGTLVEGSSWEMVHEAFGTTNQANWERYQRGELDDAGFMRSDIALWHVGDGERKHVREIEEVLARAKLMPGAHELAQGLRERGIATCVLSGGIDILARRVCEELGLDMYVANGLRLLGTGHVSHEGLVFVEIRDKSRVTRDLLARLRVPRERAAAVGNSMYDVGMFRECAYGIAVNPSDFAVRHHARHVVEGKDLREVLGHLVA
jgi:phosphoserine phosphatase